MQTVAEVGYLDPEIANEGELATLEDFQAPLEKPHIPDYSWIKPTDKLARYFPKMFGIPVKHEAWPAYLYNHKTGESKLVKDLIDRRQDPPRLVKSAADQAKELGVVWRKTTQEERNMGLGQERWDCTGDWLPTPPKGFKHSGEPGKTEPPPSQTQVIASAVATAMKSAGNAAGNIGDQVGAIVAAVVAAMKMQPQAAAPAAAPAPSALAAAPVMEPQEMFGETQAKASPDVSLPSGGVSNDDLKDQLVAAAAEKGVKIDKRWGLDRIRSELDKVANS